MSEIVRKPVKTIERGSQLYPTRFDVLPDPPARLYLKGSLPEPPLVAIVGSRNADAGARRFAFRMAGELCGRGIGVVSGGALGIDTEAHKGALDAGGQTLAVIGSGFDFLYPEANRALFAEIAGTGGLMTEFRHDQPPTKWTFPKRNRLVAALADAVLVVQAGERSGALITARLAQQLGVPLGAVPGVPGDPRNHGNHALLRRGARLVENIDDLLSLMSLQRSGQLPLPNVAATRRSKPEPSHHEHSPLEMKILEILCTSPLHIDDITTRLGIVPCETSAAIIALELEGLVEDRGGKNYVRVG